MDDAPRLEMQKLARGIDVATLIIFGDGTGEWRKDGKFDRAATPAELEEAKRAFWGLTE